VEEIERFSASVEGGLVMERIYDLGRAVDFEDRPAAHHPVRPEQASRGAITLHQTALARRREMPAHSELIRNQEAQSEVGVLFKGWACCYRLLPDGRRQILDVYLPGDLIGLAGFLSVRPQEFVLALTEITYGAIGHDTFSRLLGSPEVATHVLSMLAAETLRLDGHLTTVGQMVAEEKIAALLIEFHDRLRHREGVAAKSFHFPLTQQQIGDFLGMTVVHVNRVLKRLRDSGIVNVKHRVVVIYDMARLSQLASGRSYAPPLRAVAASLAE
jgi:CRP-like cAMP-binding protein